MVHLFTSIKFIKGSRNGGITSDALLPRFKTKNQGLVFLNLGGALPYEPNPFQASVKTGNTYKEKYFSASEGSW
jgi:hypothetical protein